VVAARGLRVALVVALASTAASAQETVALVVWGETGVAGSDVGAASDAASAILHERLGADPTRLDAAASTAAACSDAECLAGLGLLAGAARIVAVAITPATARVVVVAVTPEARETGRSEGALPRPVADWRAALAPLLEAALGRVEAGVRADTWVVDPPIVSPRASEGFLVLSSDVDGARVHVDGEFVGLTPLPRHALSPGRHSVLVAKAGWTFAESTIDIEAGRETPLRAQLASLGSFTGERRTETEPDRRWYGYATLLVDAAAITVSVWTDNGWIWLGGYLIGPPIVHVVNGNGVGAAGSFALRLLAPLLGGVIALPFAVDAPGYDGVVGHLAIGVVLGTLTAIIADAAGLAWTDE